MSSGDVLFRMVMMCREGASTGRDAGLSHDSEWSVSAMYKRSRGGNKVTATLSAENLMTGEVLTYPKDADKITSVLPTEFWPAFITDLVSDKPNQNQPSLMAEIGVVQ